MIKEIIKKDIKEVARTMTREEFLGLDSQQRIDLLNGYGCPTYYGLKSYVSFNICKPTANCTRCWNLAVEDIKFKGEEVLEQPKEYTIHNLLNDFEEGIKFNWLGYHYKIKNGELYIGECKSMKSLKEILEMKFTKVEEPKSKLMTFEEAVGTGKRIKFKYYGYASIDEFMTLNSMLLYLTKTFFNNQISNIILKGTWYAEGVYEE